MVMDLQKFRWTLGQHPIAYMSAEFGLDDRLPIYSGGLGILAGDLIRAADDMELPVVAVGLLYKEGYFKQVLDLEHGQVEEYPLMDVREAPINLVVNSHGEAIKITFPLGEHLIHFQIWEYSQGEVSVYLLDTDVPENTPAHRLITRRLYGGDKETRILQELVLGIGGVRTLQTLHIHPSLFHLNEGHSAFAIFEITSHYMQEYKMEFEQAYEYARNKIVFTNHTLVPAGNEMFPIDLVKKYLSTYSEDLGLGIEYILDKGKVVDKVDEFSMSNLALNMAARMNAVSKLHARMAKEFWPDKDMAGITNGVHMPTWVSADLKAQAPDFNIIAINDLPNYALWRLHAMAKFRLRDEVKFRTGREINLNTMIVSWARRFASYKRPETIFTDMARIKDIIFHAHRPVQFLIAGKAHPADKEGHASIKHMLQIIKDNGLEHTVIFIPNYNMRLADVLVSGSDVWLNTPIYGKEASGTSGMKAAANGVLQCSVSDGWVAEVDLNGIGWELDADNPAEHVYSLLEGEITELFYNRDTDNVPNEWIERMKKTIGLVWNDFSASRMLEDYIDVLYRPTLEEEIKDKHYHNWRRRYLTQHPSKVVK